MVLSETEFTDPPGIIAIGIIRAGVNILTGSPISSVAELISALFTNRVASCKIPVLTVNTMSISVLDAAPRYRKAAHPHLPSESSPHFRQQAPIRVQYRVEREATGDNQSNFDIIGRDSPGW